MLFQIEHDPAEMYPIASNTTEYKTVMAQINQGLADHKNSIIYYKVTLKKNEGEKECCL